MQNVFVLFVFYTMYRVNHSSLYTVAVHIIDNEITLQCLIYFRGHKILPTAQSIYFSDFNFAGSIFIELCM